MPTFTRRIRRPTAALALALAILAPSTFVTPVPGVAAARVMDFTLIDADTNQPIAGFDPIAQGATINLAQLPTRRLNIRANVDEAAKSVRLKKDGGVARVDSTAPFALVGDVRGDYRAWTPATGPHTAYAAAFTNPDGRGRPTWTAMLRFRVVNVANAGAPSAGPTPSTPPSALPSARPTPSLEVPHSSTPPSSPRPGGGSEPGGQCGPIGDAPAGWQRRVTSTFSEETRLGDWPGPRAAQDWRSRLAGYRDSSGRGIYNSNKTVSEHDGLLDIWIHSEGGTRYVAAPIPKIGDTRGQRISVCMRADRIPGYKLAFLLWPDEGPGNYHGEINFPEGKLTPTGDAFGFVHYDPKPSGGKQQDAYNSNTSTVDWHRYTLEWDPGSTGSQADDYVSFYLDGRLVGRSTGAEVPDGPMHYVMQVETYLRGQELPPPAEGHVLIDWVTIDVPG